MIDLGSLERLALQAQTTVFNLAREYCQHLFLSMFYQQKAASRILFKGGTALRIIFGSPRFSEDLDFSGMGIRPAIIEDLLGETLSAVERVGVAVELEEATTTSGGYLGIIRSRVLGFDVQTQLEISLRARGVVRPSTALIACDLLPAYTLLHLPQELLVEEKIRALLDRAKPRDWYDLYFILRKGLLPPAGRRILRQVHARLARTTPEVFQGLKPFLPRSQHNLLKGFRATLERELRSYL